MKYFFIFFMIVAPITSCAMSVEDRCKSIRDCAIASSVISGWAFYGVTSKHQVNLPYWAKRMPLFVFLASNTVIHLSSYFMGGFHRSAEAMDAVKNAAASSNVFNSTQFKLNMPFK